MPKRVVPTRTLNPLHFEDLEPHRFEDLVRRLLYGFREWIDIEPTGRSGSDEGFDIRAWERNETITNVGDEGEEGSRNIEGNLWQVQGKREKSITPAKMKSVLNNDIDPDNPPYGYILAAATNISKSTYDTFREELRAKGVRQFFFWGKDYLEDQLSLPENDEILFTFFGISLSPRRKSRISEMKFNINNKNRIIKTFFGNEELEHRNGQIGHREAVLFRDINDRHYPYAGGYPDFDTKPRWEEHTAVQVTALGVYFKCREWYAFVDRDEKTWDFTRAVDLMPRKHNLDKANKRRLKDTGRNIERYWRHIPQRNQAKLNLFGFVAFEDMLIIDDKGDTEFTNPHIFVDFGKDGPFSHLTGSLTIGSENPIYLEELEKNYQRVSYFPRKFPKPRAGKQYSVTDLKLTEKAVGILESLRGRGRIWEFFGDLTSLEEGDLIRIPEKHTSGLSSDYFAEVTHISEMTLSEYKQRFGEWEENRLKECANGELKSSKTYKVYEIIKTMQVGDNLVYLDDSY